MDQNQLTSSSSATSSLMDQSFESDTKLSGSWRSKQENWDLECDSSETIKKNKLKKTQNVQENMEVDVSTGQLAESKNSFQPRRDASTSKKFDSAAQSFDMKRSSQPRDSPTQRYESNSSQPPKINSTAQRFDSKRTSQPPRETVTSQQFKSKSSLQQPRDPTAQRFDSARSSSLSSRDTPTAQRLDSTKNSSQSIRGSRHTTVKESDLPWRQRNFSENQSSRVAETKGLRDEMSKDSNTPYSSVLRRNEQDSRQDGSRQTGLRQEERRNFSSSAAVYTDQRQPSRSRWDQTGQSSSSSHNESSNRVSDSRKVNERRENVNDFRLQGEVWGVKRNAPSGSDDNEDVSARLMKLSQQSEPDQMENQHELSKRSREAKRARHREPRESRLDSRMVSLYNFMMGDSVEKLYSWSSVESLKLEERLESRPWYMPEMDWLMYGETNMSVSRGELALQISDSNTEMSSETDNEASSSTSLDIPSATDRYTSDSDITRLIGEEQEESVHVEQMGQITSGGGAHVSGLDDLSHSLKISSVLSEVASSRQDSDKEESSICYANIMVGPFDSKLCNVTSAIDDHDHDMVQEGSVEPSPRWNLTNSGESSEVSNGASVNDINMEDLDTRSSTSE